MVREKPKTKKAQATLDSFVGRKKKRHDSDEEQSEREEKQDSEHDDGNESDALAVQKKPQHKVSAPDSSDLPPISDITAIFDDLVSHIPEIEGVAQHIDGRKLRVATMCSGTESPLLALDLIRKTIYEQYDVNLDVEHVFSCEIEPFKQAYIERNFHPPILFRDVCELGDPEAHTAYGALVPVPGDVDMLVAGTSCVDYSNLNTAKQDIDANGESGRTFRGMMSWVKQHRPPIVILENVCSAPWPRVQEYFEKCGYSATFSRVDTKNYYIPHTRTRVYLVAVNKRSSGIPNRWKELVTSKLKRPASSTLDAFLLPSDDPRIHQARQKLVQESYNALDRRTGRTDWNRCESRHQRARLEESLGSKRPLTSWEEGGSCKLPDFAWGDWGIGQVERVWDLMDISLLRSATKGVDPSYKTIVWNLSQNVDRTIGSNKVGICPCLTPSMIPYVTNRGGPMVGLEALSMQGLPVDKLLLTRETEDQLADLAGNAMSSTVVGACILAALVTGKSLLKKGDDPQSYESKNGEQEMDNVMDVDMDPENVDEPSGIVGEDQLISAPLDLTATSTRALAEILGEAERSARLCSCEGRVDMTTRELYRCQDCSATFCKKCGGRPEHNPQTIDTDANPRLPPSDFAKNLKSVLPMCIVIEHVDASTLDSLRDQVGTSISEKKWSKWRDAVLGAVDSEFRFIELKRQEIWSVIYRSAVASLELSLHPKQPEWRLFASPEQQEPANAEIRRILGSPIGRFVCSGGLFTGHWEFALPQQISFKLKIQGAGPLVPSWEARLGLMGENFKSQKVYSELHIKVPTDAIKLLDRDISGTYTLLEKCGTANGGLHQRRASGEDGDMPPLFLLFDPHRTDDSQDFFVFSISIQRLEYLESRPIVCRLDASWQLSDKSEEQSVAAHIPYKWVPVKKAKLKASLIQDAFFSVPKNDLSIPVSQDACQNATALLVCRVPLHGQAGPEWPRSEWAEVDKVHERSTFKALAWLLERVRHVDDRLMSWQKVSKLQQQNNCERCAPSAPKLQWVHQGRKAVPVEDPVQAGKYERRLKRRPNPFMVQHKLDDNETGIVRIGINVSSLLHRAMSRLPVKDRHEPVKFSWRLNTNFTPAATIDLPKFALTSNKKDKKHTQPPNFKIPLRKEQLRSLEWMLEQESPDVEPFVEEEISEAILSPLGWRAEGRAQRPVHIRGGVLADQVGYGKTAITLGLIDCASEQVEEEFSDIDTFPGKIPVKATLIVVPPHLYRQWQSEVKKFTGNRFQVLVLASQSDLNRASIKDFTKADIVIAVSTLLKSETYLTNLELIAGAEDLPSKDGRHFNAALDKTLEHLKEKVDLLREHGGAALKKEIEAGLKNAQEKAAEAFVQSKRLKGKSYREAAEKEEASKPPAKAKKSTAETKKPTFRDVEQPASRKRQTVEVVITVPPGNPSLKNQHVKAHSETEESSDVEVVSRRPRRSSKKVIEISDEDGETDGSKPQKKSNKRLRKKVEEDSSDYQGESSESAASESDVSMPSGDEDVPPKSKAKTKAKVKSKFVSKPSTKKVATSSEENPDTSEPEMDVDIPASKKAKDTRKRKTPDDGTEGDDVDDVEAKPKPAKKQKTEKDERNAKKTKRAKDDPWKLDVATSWKKMHAPPLEMFHFARKVIDEYTYLDGKIHSLITRISASRHWVLSGTPPIHDFPALKTIAAFLNLHLGVDDDGEGQSVEVKKRRREQTAVEKFHSFREVHSLEWHAHRHEVGQVFLDRYVRQNLAEIDEIPWSDKIEKIVLPAAERAIYLELEHHLRALDMTIKRGRKSESDRERRLAESLGDSKSAEEALIKRCSHFEVNTTNENAFKACDVIVRERQKQMEQCKAELLKAIKAGVTREKKLGNIGSESMFSEYIRVTRTEGVDDKDATELVVELLDEAGASNTKAKGKNQDVNLSEKVKEEAWEHREKTHEIRRLTKELVGRIRSLRYFTVVRDLQKQREEPPEVSCPGCERDNVPLEEIAVLSSCGHTGCLTCVVACAEKEECVYAASGACKSAARVINVVKGDTLGVDDEKRDGHGKHFGKKLEDVVKLLKSLPKVERVLIFVQFTDLMAKVSEALTYHKVQHLQITGSANKKSKALTEFQEGSTARVLLLNVMDESASGANLTNANHAIFLSPLLTPSKEIYKASETQAIGRLVRYGQTNHVYIWRFLTTNTIDEEIFEQRKDVIQHPV
ncbi:hypothetical protein M378DRAFT_190475 [Amanita muscaria Koide BX008]|uniref:Helicase C-terminal domain-containing protein n=1 Tax=Amanita muscaria (strain Koide BX008) TaxID=946122 RepID=A0A0C2T0H3_AMAMK|nr:hypothetical protein M378DRAFT_190475 [Amanita muscaria Koide BX008]